MIPYQNGGKYIRPIALFQAQPKGKEDATTFEKLRAELMNTGIPAEHIAIRTADVNELKNVDLLSPDCPVRYIITVNALKEGWDCPFAYILASLANKTSQVYGSALRAYVNLIVDGMDREQLATMEKAPLGFAAKIRAKIETLLDQHYKETFFTWLDRGKIVCEPSYRLPSAIHPTSSTTIYGRSLYGPRRT